MNSRETAQLRVFNDYLESSQKADIRATESYVEQARHWLEEAVASLKGKSGKKDVTSAREPINQEGAQRSNLR